jgi:hypothetical protein
LSVPLLRPWLSSRWLALVAPVYARVGEKLIRGVWNETILTSTRPTELFPDLRPGAVRSA